MSHINPQHLQQQWAELVALYPESQLCQHDWEWVSNALLPFYLYQPVKRITDVWTEHAEGLNGYLPVQVLDQHWEARWRRNKDGQRTENCRRRKVVGLVNTLAARTGWTVERALQFLKEKYESGKGSTMSPRSFSDYLGKGKGAGLAEVLAEADAYQS